jgi:NCAIR mutase (PurE)-related protein
VAAAGPEAADEVASVTTRQDSDVDAAALSQLVDSVRDGRVSTDDAVAHLRRLPFADLGFARVDHHRALRQGRAETVYGPGKTPDQCAAIVAELLRGQAASPVLLSRADDDQAAASLAANAGGTAHRHDGRGRSGTAHATVVWRPAPRRPGRVVVVTAGTADLPVADECAVTLAAHGIEPDRVNDVGVAGLHRLLAVADRIVEADAVVVVAGMEGALASVVTGLTGAPVVAVPTSVGYGASLEGVTALLGMLASCASGLAVVGIDNGFGAACAVLRLLPAAARPVPADSPNPVPADSPSPVPVDSPGPVPGGLASPVDAHA